MTVIEFQYNLANLQESLMRFAYSLADDMNDAKGLNIGTVMFCNLNQ